MTTLTDSYADTRDSHVSWTVETTTNWSQVADAWSREAELGSGTPFQEPNWLSHFYGALKHRSDVTPLIATIRQDGAVAMRLPLLRRTDSLNRIEFADLGLTDFNAPLLGPAAPTDRRAARTILRALCRALPNADILDLQKMPTVLNGRPNPMTLARRVMVSAVNGNLLTVPDDWDTFRQNHLQNSYRKENDRRWRVFQKMGGRFEAVRSRDEALGMLDPIDKMQRSRMIEVGEPYSLDEPMPVALYKGLLAHELEKGFAVLTALRGPSDELVASLLCVRDRESTVFIRLTNVGGEWAKCSPGRIIIEKTIAMLHADGARKFDFSVGNYAYKRMFGPTQVPLKDLVIPISIRGLVPAARMRVAGSLRRYPRLRAKLRAVLGKTSREEV